MGRTSRSVRVLAATLAAALFCPPAVLATPTGVLAGVAGVSSEAADFLYQLAVEYRDEGQPEDAIHELRKLLLLHPHHERARRLLTSLEAQRQTDRERTLQETLTAAEQALSARDRAMLEALSKAGMPPPSDVPQPEPALLAVPAGPSQPPASGFDPVGRLNEQIAPLRISGAVRSGFGATSEDFELWEANGDLNERNFRIAFGEDKFNTFDPNIFSRLRVNLDTAEQTGWQFHSNVTVDPWSFVGTTDKVTVIGTTPSDQVDLQLKWWSATNTAINESFLTVHNGDGFSTPEIEVKDGKTVPTRVTSTFGNVFQIPELEIDYTFQPIRSFWTGYQTDEVDFRVFPLALEDQALTSDDPLALSNHHIYWEPSPWLEAWQPGELNEGATPDDFTRGVWSDDLAFFTRDSDLTRLTALRGTSLEWEPGQGTTLQAAFASPKGLWEPYSSFDSFVGMTRLKQVLLDDRLAVGGLYTTRWGYHDRRRDATNHVYSMDATVTPIDGTTVETQAAFSQTLQDRTGLAEFEQEGWAWHTALKNAWWGERLTSRLFFTHMEASFDPGLASYRQTRDDQFWGRHLHLKRRLRLVDRMHPGSPVPINDIMAVRIGDGVDVGRDTFGIRLAGSFLDDAVQPLFDLRNVHTANGKYVETVYRNENTVKPFSWFTGKTLFLYHDLPDTTAGKDPHLVNDDLNAFVDNAAITGGLDPSLMTFSLGGEVALSKDLALWSAWERTNDVTVSNDHFPRGLLNDSNFRTFTDDGTVIREKLPFLYSQGLFPLPPYPWFDVFKAGVYVSPIEEVEFALDWTRNEFKQAGQIDDHLNHIGFTAAVAPVNRLVVIGRYVASWAVDVARLNAGETTKAESHHNLYAQVRWLISDDSSLSAEYGVGGLGSGATLIGFDPLGDWYPTLDTVHLVRVLYSNEF